MAAPLRPNAAGVYGKENWIYVTTIASTTLIATALEVNAASSLDITNIEFADSGRPSQTTNRVTQERRLGDTILFEFIGNTTYGGGDLHYQWDPQAAAGSNGKKAIEKFTFGGVSGYLVQRLGVLNSTTPAAGQFVNVYPVTIGPSFPSQAGDGETAEAGLVATFAITSAPAFGVALT
jgi:hypothetical protein